MTWPLHLPSRCDVSIDESAPPSGTYWKEDSSSTRRRSVAKYNAQSKNCQRFSRSVLRCPFEHGGEIGELGEDGWDSPTPRPKNDPGGGENSESHCHAGNTQNDNPARSAAPGSEASR